MEHFAGEITISYQYKSNPSKYRQITNPNQVIDYARTHLFKHCMEHHEEIYAIFFNNKMRAIGYTKVGQGTVNACIANVSLILQAALLSNSTAIILIHNHPSGDTEPSKEDLNLTVQIAEAATLFGIMLKDHIIISNYLSHSLYKTHPHLFKL